jgi:outer membrane receptor protein involved in Fe transport
VPYIPDHQAFVSLGYERAAWSAYLSANLVDSVCTRASCGEFEQTGSSTVFDLAVHYRLNPSVTFYSVVENLGDELHIAGRQPYGARPAMTRNWTIGTRIDF